MKKIIIVFLVIIIGIMAFFFFTGGPDKSVMKKNESAVRQYLINEEKVSSSDIIRLETNYNTTESTDKYRYMVEVELKTEEDVIKLFTVDKGDVHLFGKVSK